jgi:twinkle protein
MHVMFNYDEAKKHKKVIICEGEEEAMCWFDAGFPYAVSVDSGAPNPKDVIDRKLECFTNCFDLFENAEEVYIAVDNDENGKRLAEELERRLDIEKVKRIDFGAYKDANDVLMYEGVESLQHLYKIAKEVKMEGIFTVEDVQDQLLYNYRNGLPKGTTTHMPSIDNIWKWRESEVNTISGYANEGKSSLFNINLPVLKAVFDGWKFALFIPENFPAEQFFEDVIHCYIGKPTDIDWKFGRMTEEEFMRGLEFVKNHFFLVYPEKGFTLENIFVRFDYLVRKHGVRSVIIDPFNTVEHLFKAGETYDQYVSRFMGELIKFTQKRRLATLLVAHQNKPEKKLPDGNYPEPEPYNTKGGGTFFDKTHNYLTVWRPYRNTDRNNPLVTVTSKKIKMKKLVANVGSADIQFNWKTNRYEDPLLEFKNPLDKFSGMSSIKKVASDEDEELPF